MRGRVHTVSNGDVCVGDEGCGERNETLTDPVIWPFSTCDDEDLASRPRDRDGATDDTGRRPSFIAHDEV